MAGGSGSQISPGCPKKKSQIHLKRSISRALSRLFERPRRYPLGAIALTSGLPGYFPDSPLVFAVPQFSV
jgi:hypothetical protein